MIAQRVRVRSGPFRDRHPTILVSVNGGPDVECCGYSWCTGACGLPAAVIMLPANIDLPERECKLYGEMTACGPVVQRWRVEWTGAKHEIPREHAEELVQKWWR